MREREKQEFCVSAENELCPTLFRIQPFYQNIVIVTICEHHQQQQSYLPLGGTMYHHKFAKSKCFFKDLFVNHVPPPCTHVKLTQLLLFLKELRRFTIFPLQNLLSGCASGYQCQCCHNFNW